MTQMAHPLPRLFTRRFCQPSTFPKTFNSTPRTFRASIRNSPARRSYASGNPNSSPLKIWPFVGIIFAGSGAYVLMVKSRVEMAESNAQIAAPKKDTPTFSPASVTVIFVLGGPGAGKGTQCANLVRDYHFTHLSAGDLLRAEQVRAGSEFGELIQSYIKEGKIVPMEVTVQLLENAMQEVVSRSPDGKGKFLIDGFPRQMDQAVKFEEAVCPGRFVLFFDCPEEEMQRRLLKRGETSGRSDDNAESIKKRFKTFVETSMPVVDFFRQNNRVIQVVATKTPEEVPASSHISSSSSRLSGISNLLGHNSLSLEPSIALNHGPQGLPKIAVCYTITTTTTAAGEKSDGHCPIYHAYPARARPARALFQPSLVPIMKYVDYFAREGPGRVVRFLATKTPDEVYKETREQLKERLGKVL
ncbi:uncharacterized protein L3040_009040 [Drepanopeziza brunnea f. sp. 'multigermtubi']|uniref:uncharacterized protein n=1 Tax=Drepanopeziza brunnea f. sp. 'multigermtubi' TaxID=698441 RepID=UPI0023A6914D|nr:hypothetical protein L3040_009040 [Drepanopeziza brunnea f. sp. 'multigermtubi']